MREKTYSMELTAEEVDALGKLYPHISATIGQRVFALEEAVRADREAADLRLPWSAVQDRSACDGRRTSRVLTYGAEVTWYTPAAAKLMSAAPELLEAVKAVRTWILNARHENGGTQPNQFGSGHLPAIERALRKVETGVPE